MKTQQFEVNGNKVELYSDNSVIDNGLFLYGILDADEKIMFGIKQDGDAYIPKFTAFENHKAQVDASITQIEETLLTHSDASIIALETTCSELNSDIETLDSSVTGLTTQIETLNTSVIELSESIDNFDVIDHLYLEMTVDSSSNILSARKSDGTLVEKKLESETITTTDITINGSLNLSDTAKFNIEQIVKDMEITSKSSDYSEYLSQDGDFPLQIPMPRCAKINITGITAMPTSKTANYQAFFEMWDMQGNYFKKKVLLNAQGNSSLGMPKKNFAIDLFDSEWDGDAFALRIGDWVPQDSFHFKAYYADHFRCVNPVSYKLFEDVCMTRPVSSDRVWKRALLPSNDEIGYSCTNWETDDDDLALDNGARNFPDGFPCIVFLNGEFYGVFSWQLKKHRDNYHMSKKKSKHIHLDGNISNILLWEANGTINWNKWNKKEVESEDTGNWDGIEIRNPKDLIGMDGSEYDHDTNAVELIDSTSSVYDSTNELHVRTAEVKQYIINATTILNKIDTAIQANQSTEQIKAVIETYFDVDSLIDYLVFSDVVANRDGFKKNWQWTTYDGVKWSVNPYDLDGIMGWTSWAPMNPYADRYGTTTGYPPYYIIQYYNEELEARYKELRDAGVFTTKNIMKYMRQWINAVGTTYYQMDHDKWPYNKELYYAAGGDHYDNIYRLANWLDVRIAKCDEIYNYTN